MTDPSALHALISSVPAQTLHAYTLAHLCLVPPSPSPFAAPTSPPTPAILTALTTFFASLSPPPKLHCARCHRGYFDLENTDNACRVPHDDDSAIVERVGLTKGADAGYETLWGCCAKTVEGDGDMGPPDGWCYEGAHTVRSSFYKLSWIFLITSVDRYQTCPVPHRFHTLRRQTHILHRAPMSHAAPPTTPQAPVHLEEEEPTRHGGRWRG